MIYYIIDTRYPGGYKVINQIPGTDGKDYLYHFVYASESIDNIVKSTKQYILKAKLGFRSINMIRLCGHGNTAYVQIGQGLTESTADSFSDLSDFLTADAFKDGIQIHGCGVGSDTNILGPGSTITNPVCVPGSSSKGNGYKLLRKLAEVTNRNVTAGLNCQYVDDDWKWEGPTITVSPGGSYGVMS
ncbi:MAG: hypothetical protein ACT4O9_07575 [Blastocatellia bacterium]